MNNYRGIIQTCERMGVVAAYGAAGQAMDFLAYMDTTACAFICYNPFMTARVGWDNYTIFFGGDGHRANASRIMDWLKDLYDMRWDGELRSWNGRYTTVAVALRYKVRMYGGDGGGAAEPDALNFTMPNGGTITLTRNGNPTTVTLEYTLDGGATWTEWVENGTTRTLTLQAGEKAYIRNTSTSSTLFSIDGSNRYIFAFDATVNAGGNTNSLLCVNPADAVVSPYCFMALFSGCSTLVTPPSIPFTTLAERCYSSMFYNCTSLTTAPTLPAMVLASGCYRSMFAHCTNLAAVPSLPATELAVSCYYGMFYDCALIESAVLPATVLEPSCYSYMFESCSGLNRIVLHAGTTDSGSLSGWVVNVASTGDFYCPQNLTIPTGSSGIPSGWTRHDL